MLENSFASLTNNNIRHTKPVFASFAVACLSMAVFGLPTSAEETIVQRKVYMTGDGVTETTTTTTTKSAPAVSIDQVVVPAVPATVDRIIIPGAPVTIAADEVVVPAVPATTVVERQVQVATPVNKVVIDADVYKATLKNRADRLRAVISTGVANRTLTEAEAAQLRAELDRLAALETSISSSSQIAYDRILPLAYEYDLIGTRLKVVDYQPLVQGSKVVLSSTHVYAIDDLMRRRAGLEAKISYELASGKLSAAEADRLRGMLNHVAVIEGDFRADGEISDKEAKMLYAEFDKVGAAIDKAM